MPDRRRSTRHLCRCRVGLFHPNGRLDMVWSTDISAEGIQVHANYPCRNGQLLRFALMVFNPVLEQTIEIFGRARASYCVFDGGRSCFRIGLEFAEFEPGSEERLRQELTRLSPPTATPSSGGRERRVEPRYRYRRKVGIDLGNGTVLTAWTEDVSRNGLRVVLDRRLVKGHQHWIGMNVIHPLDGRVEHIMALGQVTYVLFGPMGQFFIGFALLKFKGDGQRIYHQEIHDRFEAVSALFSDGD